MSIFTQVFNHLFVCHFDFIDIIIADVCITEFENSYFDNALMRQYIPFKLSYFFKRHTVGSAENIAAQALVRFFSQVKIFEPETVG